MQVQDFTVIRISPIVYNDRDILEIGVISHRPQTGHTNTHIMHVSLGRRHTHTYTHCSDTKSASVLTKLRNATASIFFDLFYVLHAICGQMDGGRNATVFDCAKCGTERPMAPERGTDSSDREANGNKQL